MRARLVRKCALLGSAVLLVTGITAAGIKEAGAATTGATAATAGTLPLLPDGLNVAIGAHATANSGSAPGTSLGNIDDGDGTTRWCPSTLGIHTVTRDLGRVVDVTGAGATFSGEEGNDGSFYSISTGITRPGQAPFPNQAPEDRNSIVRGPLYPVPQVRDDLRGPVPV